jgi:hypothetical protein
MRQGIDTIRVNAPPGADAACFSLCEPPVESLPNDIADVTEDTGLYTITLDRPITFGAVTVITYTDDNGASTSAHLISHPGNVNGDSQSSAIDVYVIIGIVNGTITPPWGLYSVDIDHSGLPTPADILRVIDLLNGADAFEAWDGRSRPTVDGLCP